MISQGWPAAPRPAGVLARTRALVFAVALALTTVGVTAVAGPVAPAQGAPSSALTLTGPEQIRLGKKATLKITWRKAGKKANGKVRLQAKQAGKWVNVRKVAVTKGKATVKVAPTKNTRYRLKSGKTVSKVARVKVAKGWLNLSALDTAIKAGDPARLRMSNFKKGALAAGEVQLQYKKGKGWKTFRTVAVDASGILETEVLPSTSRTYRAVRGKLVSPERTVAVTRDWVELTLAATELESSASSTTATVRWYAKGKPATGTATLQEKVVGGKWTTVQDVAVAGGVAEVTLQPGTPRSYRVKAGGLTSRAAKVTVDVVVPASFTIRGSGWGHGLGMSQYGAYAMAQEGNSVADILTHYYTDTALEELAFPTGDGGGDQLSVQLIGSSPDNKTSVAVTVKDGGWRLRNGVPKTVALEPSKGSTITFKVESGKVAAYVGSAATPTATAKIFRLHWDGTRYWKPDSTKQTYVDVAGTHGSYRHGRLEVTVRNGRINIANNLLLNTEYLYGIAEMPSSWGIKGPASLQAQAIAARNYAASAFFTASGGTAKIKDGCRCHIVDDVRDQNFTGWRKENEGSNAYYGKLWKAAVDATVSDGGATGTVLRYVGGNDAFKGKLVTAYYSSASGGATLNSEDAWSSVVPYIRSVDDPWTLDPKSGNPNISWTATFTQSQARAFFGLPDVVKITISKAYTGGGVAELTATSSTGATATSSGKADTMRTRLNAAASGYVKSSFIRSFDPVGVY